MSRKRGLGKGLEALIPSGSQEELTSGAIQQVPIEEIRPNPRQPRSEFDEENLASLANSIREHGILQPLVIIRSRTGKGYELIAGERRLQAAVLAGLSTVPVIIRQANEQLQLELALIENLQRDDLTPLEAADGYRQLVDDFGLSHEEIAEMMGRSRTSVSNILRLLKLSAAVRKALQKGEISEGHGRALLPLGSAQAQSAALQSILERGLNVRQAEELVRRLLGRRRGQSKPKDRSPEMIALEDQLRQALGTRVSVRPGRRGGSIVLRYYSDEELNALIDRLLSTRPES